MTWFWFVVLVASAFLALIIVRRVGARGAVDPTQVSIDPAVAGQVKRLAAKGDRKAAVKVLRDATGLGLADAIRITDRLSAPASKAKPASSGSATSAAGRVRSRIGPDHRDQLSALVAAGRRDEAVALVRELAGVDGTTADSYLDNL